MSNPSAYQQLIQRFEDIKTESKQLLAGNEHPQVEYYIDSQINNILNRLHFHAGSQPAPTAKPTQMFPPITNFMGDELPAAKQATPVSVDAQQEIKANYLRKVNELYESIASLDDQRILTSYTTPEDQAVVRGVAKKAGVMEFETKPLNVNFLAEIRANIVSKEQEAQEKEAYEKKLAESNLTTKPGSATSPSAKAHTLESTGISATTVDGTTTVLDGPNTRKGKL